MTAKFNMRFRSAERAREFAGNSFTLLKRRARPVLRRCLDHHLAATFALSSGRLSGSFTARSRNQIHERQTFCASLVTMASGPT